MPSASTFWTHGVCMLYCRGREAATSFPSGNVAGMATAHVRVRSAANTTPVAGLQNLRPHTSEDVWPHALGMQ